MCQPSHFNGYFTDRNQTIKNKNFNISENDVHFGAVLLNFIVAFIPRIMTDRPTDKQIIKM